MGRIVARSGELSHEVSSRVVKEVLATQGGSSRDRVPKDADGVAS